MKAFCTTTITPAYQAELARYMDVTYGGNSAERKYLTAQQLIDALQGTDILILGYEKLTEEIIKNGSSTICQAATTR